MKIAKQYPQKSKRRIFFGEKTSGIAQTQACAAQLSSTIANNPGASSTQLTILIALIKEDSPSAQINILGVNTNQSDQMSSQPQSLAIQ
ncbi:11135_t:CDS:2, partial [Entrophospora sp. SA101]